MMSIRVTTRQTGIEPFQPSAPPSTRIPDMPEVEAMDVKGLCERLESVRADWDSADIPSADLPSFSVLLAALNEAATALSTLSRELAEARAAYVAAQNARNENLAAALVAESSSASKDERIREAHAFIAKLVHMQSGAGWTRAVVRDAAAEFLRSQGVAVEPGADTTPEMRTRSTKEPT